MNIDFKIVDKRMGSSESNRIPLPEYATTRSEGLGLRVGIIEK